jgi:predicted XRE-type DNA-binding protein
MRNNQARKPTRNADSKNRIVHGSGNIFADLGLPDADLLLAKADMASCIGAIIAARGLTQRKAAEILGIDQPGVSGLLRGDLHRYSSDRLIRFLGALGHDVEVVVTERAPSSRRRGRLRVRNAVAPIAAAAAHARPTAAATSRKAGRADPSTTRAQAGSRQG